MNDYYGINVNTVIILFYS